MPDEDAKYYCSSISSRIKKIFIELHEYSYFHGPSEINKIDSRFIGRKRIINKLKGLLKNNETRSGAYLVTGYRGMGKSSFVSKVIAEIDPSNRDSLRSSRYFRMMVVLLSLALIKIDYSNLFMLLMLIGFPILSIAGIASYLVYSDKNRENLKLCRGKKNKSLKKNYSWVRIFWRSFILIVKVESGNTFRRVIQVVFIILSIHLTALLFIKLFYLKNAENKFSTRMFWYFLLFFIIICINIVYSHIRENRLIKKKINKQQKKHNCLKRFFYGFLNFISWLYNVGKLVGTKSIDKIKNFYNFSQRVYIKINLGYDDLREIDILRLIARNIEKEYKRILKKGYLGYISKAFRFLLLLSFTGMVYYLQPLYELNIALKSQISFEKYFPSQSKAILKISKKKELKQTLSELQINYANPQKNGNRLNIVQKISNYLDLLVQNTYSKLEFINFSNIKVNKYFTILDLEENFFILPLVLDYFFIVYIFLFYLFFSHALPNILRRSSPKNILNKIDTLNEIISYNVTNEATANAGLDTKISFGIFKKKIKAHQKADIREIEKNLIEILDEFERYSRFSVKPEFIFIFDELDKIEPHINSTIKNKDLLESKEDLFDSTYFSNEAVRKRQHTIFKILSNLKHFLNTAKGKFIFIAGRELYDAALADVSDRNFFLGSIFHDVIYVNSFLTDSSDNQSSNLMSMTEQYVCRFLFPPHYYVSEYSLKEYRKYLDIFYGVGENIKNTDLYTTITIQNEIKKIIFTLRNFITYLTYRSNGAPKKITTLFENFIYRPNGSKNDYSYGINSDFAICVGLNRKNFYLEFGYYQQYNFGMISYLVNPVMLSVSKSIKDFGDKLLVSTSFLVDHLFKFHKNAFSWRNIEVTPEILDINKAPQLRELISLIINNISNNHITEIVSGLYIMKFRKKISEEISFLSKISEREAAAFNFTLDESLALKRHYKKLLADLQNHYKSNRENNEFINSISFIHMIIGDFHFYDEEYNEAIIEYMEAIQALRNQNFNNKNASFFVLLIRNMLKLGYAFEKRKSYISAFSIYEQLVSYIVDFRNIDLSKLGLREKNIEKHTLQELLKDNEKKKQFLTIPENTEYIENVERILVRNVSNELSNNDNNTSQILINQKKLAENFAEEIAIDTFNLETDSPVALSEDFSNMLNQAPFTSLKENIFLCVSSYEGIRLIYQPLIAKFQMIEKAHIGGISKSDLIRIENEYKYITKIINRKEKFLMEAEFWSKLGDILYYKNGLTPQMYLENENNNEEENCYCYQKNALCARNEKVKEMVEKNRYNVPCRSCFYYMKALKILCIDFLNLDTNEMTREKLFTSIRTRLLEYKFVTRNTTALKSLANTLSAIGDNFFSCCSAQETPSPGFFKKYFELFEGSKSNFDELYKNHKEFNKIEEVFLYYYFSYDFYIRAGLYKEACKKLLKPLYVIRNLILVPSNKNGNSFLKKEIQDNFDQILKLIYTKATKNSFRAYGNIHRIEAKEYQNIFESSPYNSNVSLLDISLSADLKEYFQVFHAIKLLCTKDDDIEINNYQFFLSGINSYTQVNRIYVRIIDLKLKVMTNYKIFKNLKFDKIMDSLDGIFHENINQKNEHHNNFMDDVISELRNKYGKDSIENKFQKLITLANGKWEELKESNELIYFTLEFLITDSIFCLHEIIKLVKIYGISYTMGYSMLANAHDNMGHWCKYYYLYQHYVPQDKAYKERCKNALVALIGVENLQFISSIFHLEQARDANFSIFELHSEGKAYKDMLDKMFYLNDDFNDATHHFHAAAERYRIHIGKIKENLDKVRDKLNNSNLYNEYKENHQDNSKIH